MNVGNVNNLPGSVYGTRTPPRTTVSIPKTNGAFDTVDISTEAGRENAKWVAMEAMADFKNAMLDTLMGNPAKSASGGLSDLTGTPVGDFIDSEFSALVPSAQNEFMSMFTNLSSAGGLVPQNLMSGDMVTANGFGQMLAAVNGSLKSRL